MPIIQPPPLRILKPHGLASFESQGRSWNGVSVYAVSQELKPGRSWQQLGAEQATVAIVLEQVHGTCEPRKKLNCPVPRTRYDAGHTMYIPADAEIWGFSESTSLVRDVRMRFDPAFIEQILEDDTDRAKWNEPLLLLYDDRLRRLGELIWEEIGAEPAGPALYGESLVTALFSSLFGASRCRSTRQSSGLARIHLKRTMDYIEANLLKDLHLKELSSLVGLSASQFGRAFKASTGMSPHRWILRRRIQFGQKLMRESNLSIANAAQMSGFASQSHFTRAFRSQTGMTPRSWLNITASGYLRSEKLK